MKRRRVSKLKYFNGTTELTRVENVLVAEVAYYDARARGEDLPRPQYDHRGPRIQAGKKPREPGQIFLTWEDLRWLPVERTVKYLAKPDPHQCDWRCLGGKPGGECWCSCGGKNHGRNYVCESVA